MFKKSFFIEHAYELAAATFSLVSAGTCAAAIFSKEAYTKALLDDVEDDFSEAAEGLPEEIEVEVK